MLLALCTSFSSLVLQELKQETENQRVISPVVVNAKEILVYLTFPLHFGVHFTVFRCLQ